MRATSLQDSEPPYRIIIASRTLGGASTRTFSAGRRHHHRSTGSPAEALGRRTHSPSVFQPRGEVRRLRHHGKDGSPAKAEGLGTANVNSFHADLTVTLDLRNLPQGTYYLETKHEGDRASYYYPLTLR